MQSPIPSGNGGPTEILTLTSKETCQDGAVVASLVVGSLDGEHVALRVFGRTWPAATDYWDGNWVRTAIEVRVGGFTAEVSADLRTDELHRFADGLRSLNENLSGTAALQSLETWIDLSVECQPNGHLRIKGAIRDEPGRGNLLAFELHHFDQTYLSGWLAQLDAIDEEFPILDPPDGSADSAATASSGLIQRLRRSVGSAWRSATSALAR
jgi:hypothetical protein